MCPARSCRGYRTRMVCLDPLISHSTCDDHVVRIESLRSLLMPSAVLIKMRLPLGTRLQLPRSMFRVLLILFLPPSSPCFCSRGHCAVVKLPSLVRIVGRCRPVTLVCAPTDITSFLCLAGACGVQSVILNWVDVFRASVAFDLSMPFQLSLLCF